MSPSEKKSKRYIDVNVPRDWEQFFEEALDDPRVIKALELSGYTKTYSGLGCLIIREFLLDNTSFRFQHLNVKDDHVTIIDNKLRRMADVYVKELENNRFELWCELCESNDCDHVENALTVNMLMDKVKAKGLTRKKATKS